MYVSVDIGGTKTRVGFSNSLNKSRFLTPSSFKKLKQKLATLFKITNEPIEAISLGVAGTIDKKNSKILKAPNIPYLNGKSPKDLIPNFKCPILLENDAALAGIAEATLGPGKQYARVAYITLSTGVGGTLIIEKKLPNTRYNLEPGHQIIRMEGRENPKTGTRGSWEAYSSGTSFTQIYGENPGHCINQQIWRQYSENLAVGLHNITLLWSPDIIILGGGVSKSFSKFIKTTKKFLRDSLPPQRLMPQIAKAALGDENVIKGGFINLGIIPK